MSISVTPFPACGISISLQCDIQVFPQKELIITHAIVRTSVIVNHAQIWQIAFHPGNI